MGSCKKDITSLLMHWSCVFLALAHRDILSTCELSFSCKYYIWGSVKWNKISLIWWFVISIASYRSRLGQFKPGCSNLYRMFWNPPESRDTSHPSTLPGPGRVDVSSMANTLKPRQNGAILWMTFSNSFSWDKIFEFLLKFHWNLFPRVQ